MTIVWGVFLIIGVFVFIVLLLTTETDAKHVPDPIEPNDTWENRYYSLVEAIWLNTPEEAREETSYDEWHQDTLDEIRAMNEAVHATRSK